VALIPLHSGALHDDISTSGLFTGAFAAAFENPSEQNPPEHFCSIGQLLSAKQGSLADSAVQVGARAEARERFITTKITSVIIRKSPIPVPSFKPAILNICKKAF
jgi:hypothetical protein